METASSKHVLGIGDLCVSDRPEDVLVTYSLGSCMGLAAWDPVTRVGGLIHCLLPTSKGNAQEAAETPARFVDTGVVALLESLYERGATQKGLSLKVAGCGHPLEGCDSFRIGPRNLAILRKVLWKNQLLIASERVGGSAPRTLTLHISDGRTVIRSNGQEEAI